MRIYSIFTSTNGEVCQAHQGSLTTFIRTSGCSVRCSYCDTRYAADHNSGMEMSLRSIVATVDFANHKNVTITGGEPMEQKTDLIALTNQLLLKGFQVSIETSGEVPFNRYSFDMDYQNSLSFVVDLKLFSDKPVSRFYAMSLTNKDFIKIVISCREDMVVASKHKTLLRISGCEARFAFSPMEGKITPKELLSLMQEFNHQDSILNIQIHKLMDLDEDKGPDYHVSN